MKHFQLHVVYEVPGHVIYIVGRQHTLVIFHIIYKTNVNHNL